MVHVFVFIAAFVKHTDSSPPMEFRDICGRIQYANLYEVNTMANTMPGGWTAFDFTITKEAQAVFDTALKNFVGVGYTPLCVATQVVAGTNYCFLCKGKVVYPEAPDIVVKLYIYKPLQGAPHISQIVQVTP